MDCRRLNGLSTFFLDEFRIVVPALFIHTNLLELIVFNTLLPQGHPRSLRRFLLPQQYNDGCYSALIHVDQDRYLGTPDRDVTLITDPAQAILVIHVSKYQRLDQAFHIVRIQTLIEHVCSIRTDVYIPWDEWGRGSVIMEMPPSDRFSVDVHGIHVVVFKRHRRSSLTYDIHSFDFGRCGCSALPLRDWERGRVERDALFEAGRKSVFQSVWNEYMLSWSDMESLGNGTFFYQVNCLTYSGINSVIG